MSDPLSVAASVVGVLSLGLQSTQYLYDFYTTYKDRDDDLTRTLERLDGLLNTLQTIDGVLRGRKWRLDEQTVLQDVEQHISQCEDVIDELQYEVKKFRRENVPPDTLVKAIRVAGRRAAYPFRRSTLEKLNEDVGALRDSLSLVLQALELKQSQNTHSEIEEMKKVIEQAQAQQVAADVRNWLRAPDATVNYNIACSCRHAGTGKWFVQSSAFTSWLEEDRSFLWLYGFAGCGKSVLCSTAIQHAFRHKQSQLQSAVAFFFFTFNDDSKQDASALLRALLLQLSGQVAGFEGDLAHLKSSSNQAAPSVSTLLEYLRRAITRSQHTYLLIDALDECPVDKSRVEALRVIETIRKWLLPGLHLLVTSRDEPDIRQSMDVEDRQMVSLKNNGVRQDILQYVSYQVDYDRQLNRWGSHREEIKNYLAEHADGVFRWVDCQLGSLRRCPQSMKHLRHCLYSLPKSLDATYERILCEIREDSKEEAQCILALLCYSLRPLNAAEVVEAITVDIHDCECYDSDRRLQYPRDLLRICPGLIEIESRKVDGYGTEASSLDTDINYADFVRIAHFSVQEYLLSERIKQGPAAGFGLSNLTGHRQISKTCLIYLCNEDFVKQAWTSNMIDEYSFALYAARYWYCHYQEYPVECDLEQKRWVLELLTVEDCLRRWLELANAHIQPFRDRLYFPLAVREPGSATYYAALLGLRGALDVCLSDRPDEVNSQGGDYGSALQAASAGGHEEVVQFLLDRGADVNAPGGFFGNALQAASVYGHETLVQLLLGCGANVDAQGGECDTALRAASLSGNEDTVRLLLNRGADVHAGNALQAASSNGHEKIVQLLLDRGADINAQDNVYGSSLRAASSFGRENIVQLLLSNGADVNIQNGDHNALLAATWYGSEKIVRLLLDRGADVNAQTSRHGSALRAASVAGHKDIVQLLLDGGADVNAQDGQCRNALQAARRYPDIQRMLLDAGARPDSNRQIASSVSEEDTASNPFEDDQDVEWETDQKPT